MCNVEYVLSLWRACGSTLLRGKECSSPGDVVCLWCMLCLLFLWMALDVRVYRFWNASRGVVAMKCEWWCGGGCAIHGNLDVSMPFMD